MDFQPVTYSVDKIVALLRAARLALPEFQRDFVWSPAKVVELLDSVSRGWPIGSLLLLQGPQPFKAKAIDEGPPLRGSVDVFVLDGQQRITSLYHALANVSETCYYVDFTALERGYQDFILWRQRRTLEREYPTIAARAARNIALISEIADNEEFFKWQSHLSSAQAHNALSLREKYLHGLKSKVYRLPVIELEPEIELEALARIFETINRTGVKLNAFDLMVAVLYPHDFNLRDKWDEAVTQHGELAYFDVDGVELLKLIALWERRHQRENNLRITVRGVRQGDVLAVDPLAVKNNWERAVQSYVEALRILVAKFGVCSPSLAPPQSMILAISALVGAKSNTSVNFDELSEWYWVSVAAQSYAQGANTRVISDTDQILSGHGWSRSDILADQAFFAPWLDPVRRNKILVNGMGAILAICEARDLRTGALLRDGTSGQIVGRSIIALSRGDARADESQPVATMVFSAERSFHEIAAEVRSGNSFTDVVDRSFLASQWVFPDATEFSRSFAIDLRIEMLNKALESVGGI